MKKTFLAFLLIGSSCSLLAQEGETTDTARRTTDTTASTTTDMNISTMNNSTNMNNTNMNTQIGAGTRSSNSNYNAYGSSAMSVPATAQYSFQRDYPMANDATWERAFNGHWRVQYKHNNDNMMMYYSDRGESYMVALPVMQSQVPPEVMEKARSTYGNNLYDITALRGYNNQEVYQARIMENGVARTEKFTADGSAVLDAPANTDAMNNTNMMNNNTNMNNSGNGTNTMQNNGTGTRSNTNNTQGTGNTNNTNKGTTTNTGTTTDMNTGTGTSGTTTNTTGTTTDATGTTGTTNSTDKKTKATKSPKSKNQ